MHEGQRGAAMGRHRDDVPRDTVAIAAARRPEVVIQRHDVERAGVQRVDSLAGVPRLNDGMRRPLHPEQ